jgi:hypothetical protein
MSLLDYFKVLDDTIIHSIAKMLHRVVVDAKIEALLYKVNISTADALAPISSYDCPAGLFVDV